MRVVCRSPRGGRSGVGLRLRGPRLGRGGMRALLVRLPGGEICFLSLHVFVIVGLRVLVGRGMSARLNEGAGGENRGAARASAPAAPPAAGGLPPVGPGRLAGNGLAGRRRSAWGRLGRPGERPRRGGERGGGGGRGRGGGAAGRARGPPPRTPRRRGGAPAVTGPPR